MVGDGNVANKAVATDNVRAAIHDIRLYEGWPLSDSMEFIDQLFDAGFYLRANLKAISYLEECKREGKIPEERRLCRILLPWYR